MNAKNIASSKENVVLYNVYKNIKLNFFVKTQNFENIFNSTVNQDILSNEINLLELIHPDDVDLFTISNPNDTLYESFEFHFRILNKDNNIIIVNGKFNRLFSDVVDNNFIFSLQLTNAKSFTTQSNDSSISEINFQAMLESTNDFIFFKDAHHIMTASSDSLAIITGYKKGKEIVGKSDYELFPKEHADVYYNLEKELYKGNLSSIQEVQPFIDENNEQGWVDNRKYPVKNSNGEIVALFGVARNVTELKNAEIEIKRINQDLLSSREMLFKLTQNVPGLIYQYRLFPDGHGTLPFASNGISEIFEAKPEDVIEDASLGFKYVYPDDVHMLQTSIHKSAQTMSDWNVQYRVDLPKKGLRWLNGVARPEKLDDGSILWHGYIHDITLEKKQFEHYVQQVAEHNALLETTSDGYWAVDEYGNIIDVNDAYCMMSGYSKSELLTMKITDIEDIESEEETKAHLQKVIQNGSDTFDTVHRKKNGEEFNVNITVTYLKLNGLKFITSIRDITQSKKQAQEIQHLAYFDKLTNLPNRTLLADRIEHAIKHSHRNNRDLAICMVDLDGFKEVNDSFGHDAGDMVLIEAAKRMKSEVREDDTVARLGGDEFVIILTDIMSNEDCSLALQRILDSLSKTYIYNDKRINCITASIGVSVYSQDKAHSDALLRHADIAMYKSKNSGKNKFTFFDIASENKVKETSKILNRMKNAIKSDQFCLYYQPKYATRSKIINEVEALVRWNHPILGLLSPAEFLPIIQGNAELTLMLDQWVVNEALKQLVLWNEKNIELKVCINISPIQLKGNVFQNWLCGLIGSEKISKKLLQNIEFEILETAVIDNIAESNNFINRLRENGVSFALDDFGTGFSSLLHLKSLHINTIKIDQIFVREMFENSASMTIVKAVIALSKAFDLTVTAEGAATIEHVNKLIQMGCDEIQGYAISRPLPASDILDFITNFEWTQNKQNVEEKI